MSVLGDEIKVVIRLIIREQEIQANKNSRDYEAHLFAG
jgi:hypothetical protein